MPHPIPVVICIDVEPDRRLIDHHQRLPWRGYEETFEVFSSLRERMAKQISRPVHFTWFYRMDPQITETYGHAGWAVSQYPRYFDKLVGLQDEIALHVHAYRWDAGRTTWIVDHGNQDWINYCVMSSVEAFGKATQLTCRSFRFGDRWMNTETLKLLESLGIQYDLTIEPGKEERPALVLSEGFTGKIPAYHGFPLMPYKPSLDNIRSPDPLGTRTIWEIPMSTGTLYGPLRIAVGAYWKLFKSHLEDPLTHALYLSMPPLVLGHAVDRILDSLARPYLTFVLRTDACLDKRKHQRLYRNLNALLSHHLSNRFIFSTPPQALSFLGYY